jgi:carbon storage regulator
MLVLARREGERVRIGDDVWITVLEIRENCVRLGFDAPPTVPVLREEIIEEGDRAKAVRVG